MFDKSHRMKTKLIAVALMLGVAFTIAAALEPETKAAFVAGIEGGKKRIDDAHCCHEKLGGHLRHAGDSWKRLCHEAALAAEMGAHAAPLKKYPPKKIGL
jgi:hypothetical protein